MEHMEQSKIVVWCWIKTIRHFQNRANSLSPKLNQWAQKISYDFRFRWAHGFLFPFCA